MKNKKIQIIKIIIAGIIFILINNKITGFNIKSIITDIVLFIGIAIIVFYVGTKRKNPNIDFENLKNQDCEDKLELMGLTTSEFKNQAFKIFTDTLTAYMNFDEEALKQNVTGQTYFNYLNELETLKQRNEQNILKDFEKVEIKIPAAEEDNDVTVIMAYIHIILYDYIIDTNTNKVIKGSSTSKVDKEYMVTFAKDSSNDPLVICPNCGEKIVVHENGRCEYCNAVVDYIPDRFIITNIECDK